MTYLDNDDFATTGELDSLLKALQAKGPRDHDIIISYGDVLFNSYIPQALLQEKDDFVIFVDSDWQEKMSYTRLGGFAECTAPNSRKAFNAQISLKQLGTAVPPDMIHGVWMGFFKVSPQGITQLQEILSGLPDGLNLCGATSLPGLTATLTRAALVISNDSGAMHLTAALHRPQVALFGSSNPAWTSPVNGKAHTLSLGLDCAPCYKRTCPLGHTRCLVEIAPGQVTRAALELLG